MKRSWSIDDAKIQSRSRISPWQGYQCSALPIHTLVRGRFVMNLLLSYVPYAQPF